MDIRQPVQKILASTINGSTATLLASGRLSTGRHTIEIVNDGTETVYIGGSDVTESNGMPIKGGTSRVLPVYSNTELYVTGGSVTLIEYFG